MDRNWKIKSIYHIEAVEKILSFAKTCNVDLLPISGSWLCLEYSELLNSQGLDLFPEFIIDEKYFSIFTIKLIECDNFILRNEAENFNRFAIKLGEEYLYFNIYKNSDIVRDFFVDLPTNLIWKRSLNNNGLYKLKYEDGILTILWRAFHLLYKDSTDFNFESMVDLVSKSNSLKLQEYSKDFKLLKFMRLIIDKKNKQNLENITRRCLKIPNESLRKIYLKAVLSDSPFEYGISSIYQQFGEWKKNKIILVQSNIVGKFAKSYIVRKEIGNKENDQRLLNRLSAEWNVENKIAGKFLISASSGLWYLNGKKLKMILPGGCFGITGGLKEWYVCQYTGNYSRILKFDLIEEKNEVFMVNKKNYLKGLSPNIHQIDLYKNRLYVVNAEENSILVSNGKNTYSEYFPNKRVKKGAKGSNHFNSVFVNENGIHLMAHNGTTKDERDSEIYILDINTLRVKNKFSLNAQKAHNIFFVNNSLAYCNSPAGELIINESVAFKNENYFLRGIAITEESIIAGGSEFATRENRDKTSSIIFELDYSGKLKNELLIKNIGQIYDIRYVGNDLGMSDFAN